MVERALPRVLRTGACFRQFIRFCVTMLRMFAFGKRGVVAEEVQRRASPAATSFCSKNRRNRRESPRKVKKKPVRLESYY